jgi:GNAT superfamily N-acetyltransferase
MSRPPPDVRIAAPGDAEAVSAVLAASYEAAFPGWYAPDVLVVALPAMTRANPDLLASGSYFVAAIDGAIAACGGWTEATPGTGLVTPGVGHVRHFATHPAALRRGLAGAILAACIDQARARGITTFDCFSSLAAEAFYAAQGFEALRRGAIPLGPAAAFPVVAMRRQL